MKSPTIMYTYAGFLVLCGLVAFALATDRTRAMTALYASGGSAVIMVICGIMGSMIHRNRTAGMIGIHAGMVIPFLLGLLFSFLAYARFTAATPVLYLATIFAIMAIGSFIAFGMILATRPPMEKRA
jgi:hypothetical protein